MNSIERYLTKHELSQEEFGKRLGVTQGMVWQWIERLNDPKSKRGSRITAERALEIETATNGEVTRVELRPDVFAERAA